VDDTAPACLTAAGHILERKRMQMESFPKHAQHIKIAQPVGVDPGRSFVVEVL
jgi:hypothetical protein